MTRDRRGDVNRRWVLQTHDFWLNPGMENIGEAVDGKPAGKYIRTDAIYRTDPWYGMGCKERISHFRCWENLSPWEIWYCLGPQGLV